VKFSDTEFGEFFYRSVKEDIEKVDLLLEGFHQYLLISAPLKKENTVHRLIEEALKKYQIQLKEKKVALSKRYERGLPETIVPDEPLRYIINSIFQYGVKAITPNGDMEVSTRDFMTQREVDVGLRKKERCIEVRVVFTGDSRPGEPFKEGPIFHKEEPLDLILRLVEEVVRRNRGVMEFNTDEKRVKTFLSVRVPAERREIFFYQSIDQLVN